MNKKEKKNNLSTKKKKTSAKLIKNRGPGLWFCLIFFVSFWMFILGIYVGRKTTPVLFDTDKIQKEFAALRESAIKKEKNRLLIDAHSLDNKTELEFYETLKSDERENGVKTGIPGNASFFKKKDVHKKALSKKISKKADAAGVDNKKTNNVHFTIQVAATKNLKLADQMISKLIKKGYPAYRTTDTVHKKGTWHRIRIGSFKNKAGTMDTVNKLIKENYKPYVVPVYPD